MIKITEILADKITKNRHQIADFFATKFQKNPPLFYNSVDLRHSGFKIAPVDTNCFPAGFNNLSKESKNFAQTASTNFLKKYFPEAKKILIIPENHTRNLRYLSNISALVEITSESFETKVGSLIEDAEINLENGEKITLFSIKKVNNKIITKNGFEPDLIILNNDLTDGIPEVLQNISQPIIPSTEMGWFKRTKSHHFNIYNQIAAEIAQIIDIDSWLISSIHRNCHEINFKEQQGLELLANHVDDVISELKDKYQKYQINDEPYCYVKADNGTYGMAVWAVKSGSEIIEINKKERNKMNMLKGSVPNNQVIIQEGIKTIDRIHGKIAEPMIYLLGGEIVGNLFRANENRDDKISLNAAGASFFDLKNLNDSEITIGANRSQIGEIYSLIAKSAALAAAIENQQTHNDKS